MIWEDKLPQTDSLKYIVLKKEFAEKYHINPLEFDKLSIKLVNTWRLIDYSPEFEELRKIKRKKMEMLNGRRSTV